MGEHDNLRKGGAAMTVAGVSGRPDDCLLEAADACLFCGETEADLALSGVCDHFFKADPGNFDFVRCRACGSLWLPRRPTGQRLLDAYAGYYTHGDPDDAPVSGGLKARLRAAYVADRFAARPSLLDRTLAAAVRLSGRDFSDVDQQFRFAPNAPADILDYGCGSGQYLLRMQPLGHRLHGAEYDPQLLTNLAGRGIAVEDVATLRDDRWDSAFDHITLAHVIEHVPDPAALLKRLARWLRPGGTLFVEVPNGGATGLDIFAGHWRGLEVPRHFALPTRNALIAAFLAAGLTPVRQHINRAARGWVWAESLAAAPADSHDTLRQAMVAAPGETETNAEFLTFVARKSD